jgi:hypothetical protein
MFKRGNVQGRWHQIHDYRNSFYKKKFASIILCLVTLIDFKLVVIKINHISPFAV